LKKNGNAAKPSVGEAVAMNLLNIKEKWSSMLINVGADEKQNKTDKDYAKLDKDMYEEDFIDGWLSTKPLPDDMRQDKKELLKKLNFEKVEDLQTAIEIVMKQKKLE